MKDETEDVMVDIITSRRLLRFAVPSIILMVFTSSYAMVDGLFVSNFVSTDALAAVNLLMPVASVFTATGFLFATGGSALVNTKIGEGRLEEARRDFSLITLVALAISLVFTVVGIFFIDPIVNLLGADSTLHAYAADYGRVCVLFAPLFVLQLVFDQFLIVAGRPSLSLLGVVVGGLGNLLLDYVFIVPMGMGIEGAAWASAIGCAVPCAVGVIYFVFSEKSPVRFTEPSHSLSTVVQTASNGVSEMVSEASSAVTVLLFNLILMHLSGADGVASFTVLCYSQFLAVSLILGYSMGVAPVASYNNGAQRRDVLRMIFKTSVRFVAVVSVVVFIVLEVFADGVIQIFASGSPEVTAMAVSGLRIYAFAFLFMGFNLYASSLFTSLSNGKLSAVISFSRGLLLIAPLVLLLSWLMGLDGVWLSVPLTEVLTLILSCYLVKTRADSYGYI